MTIEQIEDQDCIDKALWTLSPRERFVLVLLYGLHGIHPWSHQDVADHWGVYSVTKERIRQIEQKALRKLRHPSKVKLLTGKTVTKCAYKLQKRAV